MARVDRFIVATLTDLIRSTLHQGRGEYLPNARLTFDKFHVVAHASKALDTVRRQQQKADPELKGMRWTLLKDANNRIWRN
jgi:transposase